MFSSIRVAGKVLTEPVLEETFNKENIYSFTLGVYRFTDGEKFKFYTLPVRISDSFDSFNKIHTGVNMIASCSIRSSNKFDKRVGRKRLMVSLLCTGMQIIEELDEVINEGQFTGVISSKPYFFSGGATPKRCDTMIKIDRSNGKYTMFPLTVRGDIAYWLRDMPEGTKISCKGFIRSRDYPKYIEKTGETVMITVVEFVANRLERATD